MPPSSKTSNSKTSKVQFAPKASARPAPGNRQGTVETRFWTSSIYPCTLQVLVLYYITNIIPPPRIQDLETTTTSTHLSVCRYAEEHTFLTDIDQASEKGCKAQCCHSLASLINNIGTLRSKLCQFLAERSELRLLRAQSVWKKWVCCRDQTDFPFRSRVRRVQSRSSPFPDFPSSSHHQCRNTSAPPSSQIPIQSSQPVQQSKC